MSKVLSLLGVEAELICMSARCAFGAMAGNKSKLRCLFCFCFVPVDGVSCSVKAHMDSEKTDGPKKCIGNETCIHA